MKTHKFMEITLMLLVAARAHAVIVTTLPASYMSNTVAMLNGTVNPEGTDTTSWFEWGTVANYYNFTNIQMATGSGATPVTFSNLLSGLTPGVIYHSHMVASNLFGIRRGSDVLFGSPAIVFNGSAVVTNECHNTFTDATAVGAPLAIAGGGHNSLALRSDGTVKAWGYGNYGQTTIPPGLSNVVAIAGGARHNLALRNDGTVVAWGDNTWGATTLPIGLSNVVAIVGGNAHNLALKNDGTVVAWGYNYDGQTNVPVGLSNLVGIAAGYGHSLALKSDGTVTAWGSGRQTTIPFGLNNVVAIAAGEYHNLALKNDGTVVAWGDNTYGQTNIPMGLSNVVAIAGGGYHSMALKNDGTVTVWGGNGWAEYGQRTVPAGLNNVVAIAGGWYHCLALQSNGTVAAWGLNNHGQTTIPAALSALGVAVSGTFNTNNSPGTFTRIFTSSNSLGGIGTATITVVVRDTKPPVITVLGNNPLTLVLNATFVDPGAIALDNCDGSSAIITNSSVNTAVRGIYTINYSSSDSFNNSTNKIRTVWVITPPLVAGPTAVSNGTFRLNFTNTAGAGFSILASTNLALPFNVWSNLGSAVETPTASGQFQFTDLRATNKPQRFYRVRSP